MPVVYYGDEIGLTGAADPDNRRPMPWADQDGALSDAQETLRSATARLARLRHDVPALRHGALETLRATETLWVFRRTSPGSDVVVALNTGAADAPVRLAGLPTEAATDALDPRSRSPTRTGSPFRSPPAATASSPSDDRRHGHHLSPADVHARRPGGSGDPFGEIALRLFGGGRLTVGQDDYDLESDWLVRLGPAGPRRGDRRALATRPTPLPAGARTRLRRRDRRDRRAT